MTFTAFLDESGDHGLENIDPTSPVFVLTAAVYRTEGYHANELARFARVKTSRWGHEGIVLHSYDIRKKQGPFAFCRDPEEGKRFYEEVSRLVAESSVTLVAAAIDKDAHKRQYANPGNPYYLSVQFVLERIGMMCGTQPVQLVYESRGSKEDDIVSDWTDRIVGGENYSRTKLPFRHCFSDKANNVCGLQMADLASYPISHYVRDRETQRPDWLAVKGRIRNRGGRYTGYGLKIFPK